MLPDMKALLAIFILFFSSCMNPLQEIKDLIDKIDDSDDGGQIISSNRVIEPSKKISLALGGVAPGRDELIVVDENGEPRSFLPNTELSCTADPAIVQFKNRPGFSSLVAGGGALLVALSEGVAEITCAGNGFEFAEKYEVTIPPQNLLQILLAEASTQLNSEAVIANQRVALSSQSPTANTLAAVIRNRIELILENDNPALFGADAEDFYANPPSSYYNAVILADKQFSPTNFLDPNYPTFVKAQDRTLLSASLLAAYDQAVLTAAAAFNEDLADPTNGAFAFNSPSEAAWELLETALISESEDIPAGVGTSDANFPAFAPIQVVIDAEIWAYENGRPSFVFSRMKEDSEAAVIELE